MEILEYAESIEYKEKIDEARDIIRSTGSVVDEDLGFYETAVFFELKEEDLLTDKIDKIREIYEWALQRGEVGEVLRDLDIQLGMPIMDKLNKIWSYIRLNKTEEKILNEFSAIQRQKQKLKE